MTTATTGQSSLNSTMAKLAVWAFKAGEKAGTSEKLHGEIGNLAQNSREGSRTANFCEATSKALSIASIAATIYGLVKPLTIK